MTDSEKVIMGLECCATNRLHREDCEAMDCVYLDLEGQGCIHQLIRDALAMLKAQEPIDAIPMDWMDAQIRGYASALKSTELKALVLVKQMWEKAQEAR